MRSSLDGSREVPEEFLSACKGYESANQVRSFWLGDQLIGVYVTAGNYIRDFVVDPDFQNRGYGSMLLKSCMYRMRSSGMEPIYLRVAKSNAAAKRFYEKHGFIEISYFAEHTAR